MLGKEHPFTLTSMNNLALVLSSQGKYEEAEEMHGQALALMERVLGKEHPSTLASMINLASVSSSQGKHKQAEEMHGQALALWQMMVGKEHPSTLTSIVRDSMDNRNDSGLEYEWNSIYDVLARMNTGYVEYEVLAL